MSEGNGNGNGRPAATEMLLAAGARRKRNEVQVEGVEAPIVIVEMNVKERLAFFRNTKTASDDDFNFTEWAAWLLVACLSDASGARLFSLDEEGFQRVTELSEDVFSQLTKEAIELHGFFKGSGTEDAEKNSQTLQSENSSSNLASSMESPSESLASV